MKGVITLFKWIFLGVFAFLILKYVTPIAFLIGLFTHFFRRQIGEGISTLSIDFKYIALSLDQLGNVTVFNWLWFLFKTSKGYMFGNPDETISYVLKINHDEQTLTKFGLLLYNIINMIDKGHFDNLTS